MANLQNTYPSNIQIHANTNNRIYDRNIPSAPLQPYINARPVMTKYSIFPIIDPRKPANVPLKVEPIYNNETVFNPGTSSPYSGYATNINKESELKNQIYALQSCSQSVYIPSSKSDLYMNYGLSSQITQQNYPHSLLFKEENYNEFNPNPYHIGVDLFNNNTRVQIKNINPAYKNNC
jgi:hypothetical protein